MHGRENHPPPHQSTFPPPPPETIKRLFPRTHCKLSRLGKSLGNSEQQEVNGWLLNWMAKPKYGAATAPLRCVSDTDGRMDGIYRFGSPSDGWVGVDGRSTTWEGNKRGQGWFTSPRARTGALTQFRVQARTDSPVVGRWW